MRPQFIHLPAVREEVRDSIKNSLSLLRLLPQFTGVVAVQTDNRERLIGASYRRFSIAAGGTAAVFTPYIYRDVKMKDGRTLVLPTKIFSLPYVPEKKTTSQSGTCSKYRGFTLPDKSPDREMVKFRETARSIRDDYEKGVPMSDLVGRLSAGDIATAWRKEMQGRGIGLKTWVDTLEQARVATDRDGLPDHRVRLLAMKLEVQFAGVDPSAPVANAGEEQAKIGEASVKLDANGELLLVDESGSPLTGKDALAHALEGARLAQSKLTGMPVSAGAVKAEDLDKVFSRLNFSAPTEEE